MQYCVSAKVADAPDKNMPVTSRSAAHVLCLQPVLQRPLSLGWALCFAGATAHCLSGQAAAHCSGQALCLPRTPVR